MIDNIRKAKEFGWMESPPERRLFWGVYRMQAFPKNQTSSSFRRAGTFTLALRLVVGWTYFSAFWRRLVLSNKLDEGAGYIGEKFNHFLPNALLIKPLIEFLVSHEHLLWWFMLSFTLIECLVGLFLLLGLFVRLMSLGSSARLPRGCRLRRWNEVRSDLIAAIMLNNRACQLEGSLLTAGILHRDGRWSQ